MAKNKAKKVDDQKMVDKVNKSLKDNDDSLFSRMVGIGLIIFGVLLVVLAVVLVVLSRKDPKVDSGIAVPTVEVDRYTDTENVTLMGETEEGKKIMVWVNDELQADYLDVVDGKYESKVNLNEDGDYEIKVAALKGWIFKTRSESSDAEMVTVDTVAPSSDVDLVYPEQVKDGVVSISGQAKEGNVKVTLDGDKDYEVTADKDGKFEFSNLSLAEGSNKFRVVVEDKAGNKKTLARKIVVTSSVADTGDLDGDGISDNVTSGKVIPEAAGELSDALNAMFANKLMVMFGLIAMAGFAASSIVVAKKAQA